MKRLLNNDSDAMIRQLVREMLFEAPGPTSQRVVIGPVGSTFQPVAMPGLGKIIIASAFAKAYDWIGDYTGTGCILGNPNYPCTRSHPLFVTYTESSKVAAGTPSTPTQQGSSFSISAYTDALTADVTDLKDSYDSADKAAALWQSTFASNPGTTTYADLPADNPKDTGPRADIAKPVGEMLGKTCIPTSPRSIESMEKMILEKLAMKKDFKAFLLQFVDSAHKDFISYTNSHSSKFKIDPSKKSLAGVITSQQREELTAYNNAIKSIKQELR